MAVSIKRRLSDFSPLVCRCLARNRNGKHPKVMTDKEIADKSGLDISVVCSLQWRTSWEQIDMLTAIAYMQGCGIDLNNWKDMDRNHRYLTREPSWLHLKRSDEWKTRWLPMLLMQGDYNERQ